MVTEPVAPPRHAEALLIWGASILVLLASIVVVQTALFAVGAPVTVVSVVVGLAAQAAFALYAFRAEREPGNAGLRTALVVGLSVVLIGGAVAVERLVPDTSVDGSHYHTAGIRQIANGWNPLRDPEIRSSRANSYERTNAYPKGTWTIEAILENSGLSIASTKILGLVVAAAALLIALGAMLLAGSRWPWAGAVAVAAAANPVVSAQVASHMVDGVAAGLLASAAFLTMSLVGRERARWIVFVPLLAATGLLLDVKQSSLVVVPLVVGMALVWAAITRRITWSFVVGAAVTWTLVVLLVGFNPYVTNLIRHDNPLYTVYGDDGATGLIYSRGEFADLSGPEALAASVFSRTGKGNLAPVDLKLPFVFDTVEWSNLGDGESRTGGFGPWFSGILLIAGVAAVFLLVDWRRKRLGVESRALLLLSGLFLVSVLVMPRSYVPRFAPQLWLVPLLALAAQALTRRGKGRDLLAAVGVTLLVLTAVVGGLTAVRNQVSHARRYDAALARLRHGGLWSAQSIGWLDVNRARLADGSVRVRFVEHVDCPERLLLTTDGRLRQIPPGARLTSGDLVLCPVDAPRT